MKKYIIAVFVFFVPCITHAITMCAKNNSLVGSIKETTTGDITGGFSNSEPLWRIVFPWGTIFGEATFLSEAEGGKATATGDIVNVDGKMIPMDTPAGLVGNDENGNPREYCWCRMTHPVSSVWTFVAVNTGAACQYQCFYHIRYNLNSVQKKLYKSVFDTLADED